MLPDAEGRRWNKQGPEDAGVVERSAFWCVPRASHGDVQISDGDEHRQVHWKKTRNCEVCIGWGQAICAPVNKVKMMKISRP